VGATKSTNVKKISLLLKKKLKKKKKRNDIEKILNVIQLSINTNIVKPSNMTMTGFNN